MQIPFRKPSSDLRKFVSLSKLCLSKSQIMHFWPRGREFFGGGRPERLHKRGASACSARPGPTLSGPEADFVITPNETTTFLRLFFLAWPRKKRRFFRVIDGYHPLASGASNS